jgi:hypothetical protein
MCSASKVEAELFNGLPLGVRQWLALPFGAERLLGALPLTCWAKGRTKGRAQMQDAQLTAGQATAAHRAASRSGTAEFLSGKAAEIISFRNIGQWP